MTETKPVKKKEILSSLEKWLLVASALMLIGGLLWLDNLLGTYKAIIDRLPDHSEESRTYSAENIQNPVRVLLRSDDKHTSIYQEARDKKTEIENDFIKDKRGLNAQEGMWYAATELLRFTAYQLFFLVITTIVSFAGLYFIIKTFKQTQRANVIAQDSLNISNRPLCDVILSETADRSGFSVSHGEIRFHFDIINFGNTPAFHVSQHFFVCPKDESILKVDEDPYDLIPFYRRLLRSFGGIAIDHESGHKNIIFPTRLSENEIEIPETPDRETSANFNTTHYSASAPKSSVASIGINETFFYLVSITDYRSRLEMRGFTLYKMYEIRGSGGFGRYRITERPSFTDMTEKSYKHQS